MHEIIKRLDDIGSNLGWPVYAAVARDAAAIIRTQAERIAHLERAEARLLAERHQEAALRQTAEERAAWCAAECLRFEILAFAPTGTNEARRTWRQLYDEAVAVGTKQREEIDLLKQQLASSCHQLSATDDAIDELRRRLDAAGTRGVELTSTIAALRNRLAAECEPTPDDPLGQKTWREKYNDARLLASKLQEELEGERKRASELRTQLDFSRAEVEHWDSLYWAMLKQAAEIESMKAPAPIAVKVIGGDYVEMAKEQVGQAAGRMAANTLGGANAAHGPTPLESRLRVVDDRLQDAVTRLVAVENQTRALRTDTSRLSERLGAHAETLDQHIQNHHNADARSLFERVFGQKG